ncbi:hypothetical protein EDF67_10678 [Sphingobacterium sp. JUb78]|jgi:hypothetical protein|nr:hypothetical protein [Sphingobacterium kitahiroshimense]TCR08922.1 hypothetical protein EDF67_10678 [Sphingobacterium sp. JUb78]
MILNYIYSSVHRLNKVTTESSNELKSCNKDSQIDSIKAHHKEGLLDGK